MLFEAGGAVVIKNSKIYFEENNHGFDDKSCTITHFVTFEEQHGGQRNIKCLAKPAQTSLADSFVQFAVPCICMRGIGCDSQTVKKKAQKKILSSR